MQVACQYVQIVADTQRKCLLILCVHSMAFKTKDKHQVKDILKTFLLRPKFQSLVQECPTGLRHPGENPDMLLSVWSSDHLVHTKHFSLFSLLSVRSSDHLVHTKHFSLFSSSVIKLAVCV